MRPTGRFGVGGQRLAIPPIRGRAGELKVIGGVGHGAGAGARGCADHRGPAGHREESVADRG